MAPVLPRRLHTLSGFYPPIRGAPPISMPGPKTVTVKATLELFTGTFCIFVVAVLFWKMGNFFRRFSKAKVIGGGSGPACRYLKTWYGWVPLQRRKADKATVQEYFAKVRQWATWNSAKNSYSSVWWSSNQAEQEAYRQDSMCRQRLRTHLRIYKSTTADTICAPYGYNLKFGKGAEPYSSLRMTGPLQPDIMLNHRATRCRLRRRTQCRNLLSARELFKNDLECVAPATRVKWPTMILNYHTIQAGKPSTRSLNHKRFLSLGHSTCILTENDLVFQIPNSDPLAKQNHSRPCLSDYKTTSWRAGKRSEAFSNSQRPTGRHQKPRNLRVLLYSRRYQIWSARMALNAPELGRSSAHRYPVPPGSPRSELLARSSTHETILVRVISKDRGAAVWNSWSSSSDPSIRSIQQYRVERASVTDSRAKITTVPARPAITVYPHIQCQIQPTPSVVMHQNQVQFHSSKYPSTRPRKSIQSRGSDKERRPRNKKDTTLHGTTCAQIIIPLKRLSNYEIMLIDSLDRKLRWLSHQLMPGRKPFHFPLLPNHWLNIRTWIVYDPASRVPIDVKRRFGDPRFNTPTPRSQRAKRKYPTRTRKVANTPRIESWRRAVNQNRKSSGLRDLVKQVELYDSSADDPPDGYIDPVCWLIRKPPQGYQLSARQHAVYYEGGAGWQERLDDWQNIRRGYRIHKAVHEGRANRTRAKEVAVGITRFCQTAWSRRQNQQI
ncbi:hypothetical protein BDV26DRAFT_299776 [Aspergillus bertholletiae]|uniref:Uncharacterized protein n=1 Tax=Aspergillus bertholletiae TaxID=1226010 RepID=A0A5N7B1Z1_9EURO|nr:hypothetical protein BDV26DRAFT_299776 [Aspergillus bertholletiae]